jgi:F-type H+-transporting ATPase subunit a
MEVTLAAEKIGSIFGFPITNSILTSWIVTLVLVIGALIVSRSYKRIPSGFQNFVEAIIEALYNFSESIALEKTKAFFPFIATFFLFIITANYIGLLPGVGTIGFWETHQTEPAMRASRTIGMSDLALSNLIPGASAEELEKAIDNHSQPNTKEGAPVFVPLFRSANSDLNITLAMGLISVVVTHFFAIKFLGIKEYSLKYFSLNPIYLFVGILELVAELTKVLSLSLRLFGNVYSGEALLATISTLAAFIAPLPFYFLEIIVGFVQATIFAVLTLVFMAMLSQSHHAEEQAH